MKTSNLDRGSSLNLEIIAANLKEMVSIQRKTLAGREVVDGIEGTLKLRARQADLVVTKNLAQDFHTIICDKIFWILASLGDLREDLFDFLT